MVDHAGAGPGTSMGFWLSASAARFLVNPDDDGVFSGQSASESAVPRKSPYLQHTLPPLCSQPRWSCCPRMRRNATFSMNTKPVVDYVCTAPAKSASQYPVGSSTRTARRHVRWHQRCQNDRTVLETYRSTPRVAMCCFEGAAPNPQLAHHRQCLARIVAVPAAPPSDRHRVAEQSPQRGNQCRPHTAPVDLASAMPHHASLLL
jgi:hypothetical protein